MTSAYFLPTNIASRFSWVCWEAEALLYEIDTGNTHRAFPPAGYLIEFLNSGQPGLAIAEQQIIEIMRMRSATPPEETLASLAALSAIGLLKQTHLADC